MKKKTKLTIGSLVTVVAFSLSWLAFSTLMSVRYPNGWTLSPSTEITGDRWDPIGEFNAQFESIPEEELAWPLIVRVDAGINRQPASYVDSFDWDARSGDDEWESVVQVLDDPDTQRWFSELDHLKSLDMLGTELGDGDDPIEAKYWNDGFIADPSTERPPSVRVLLHAVMPIDKLGRMLRAEAARAIEIGDARRWESARLRELELLRFGWRPRMGILVGSQARKFSRTVDSLGDDLIRHPALFTESRSARIETKLADAIAIGAMPVGFDFNAIGIEDSLRRLVDERGTVVLGTARYQNLMEVFGGYSIDGVAVPPPSSARREAIDADVLEAVEVGQNYYESVPALIASIPWGTEYNSALVAAKSWIGQGTSSMARRRAAEVLSEHLYPVSSFAADVRLASSRVTALRLALAVHRHRLRHGDPPQGLADIDDDLITFDPIDGFTGGPMQFRWRDGAPFVYTYGPDKDDDGGRHVLDDEGEVWMAISDELLEAAPDGDFVLFPSPIE